MKDLNKEITCRMEELKATPERYLAVLAAFHVAAGLHSIGDAPSGYTRGDFKRAIRTIKATQVASEESELVPILKEAAKLIRREWLHKEAAPPSWSLSVFFGPKGYQRSRGSRFLSERRRT